MAELGIIASVIQIADTGLRLSIKLYTFGEIVASADKSIISISKDVSLTSSVLKELGQTLENDGKRDSKFLTQTAIDTADDVVKECLEVFEEMENIIVKKMPKLRAPGVEKSSKAAILLERLKWPYLQPKLQLLQSNLDRLKSTILLMLNVITYARQVAAKNASEAAMMDQKDLIEDLAQTSHDYTKKFEDLRLGIDKPPSELAARESSPDPPTSPPFPLDVKLLNFNIDNDAPATRSEIMQFILETHAPSADDPRLMNLRHYFDLLTTMLDEVDEPKYQILLPSRSRLRVAIHDTFDLEMHFLAPPFGDDLSKRVRDHFASLVAASRNKWSRGTSDPFTSYCNARTGASDTSSVSDSLYDLMMARDSEPAERCGRRIKVSSEDLIDFPVYNALHMQGHRIENEQGLWDPPSRISTPPSADRTTFGCDEEASPILTALNENKRLKDEGDSSITKSNEDPFDVNEAKFEKGTTEKQKEVRKDSGNEDLTPDKNEVELAEVVEQTSGTLLKVKTVGKKNRKALGLRLRNVVAPEGPRAETSSELLKSNLCENFSEEEDNEEVESTVRKRHSRLKQEEGAQDLDLAIVEDKEDWEAEEEEEEEEEASEPTKEELNLDMEEKEYPVVHKLMGLWIAPIS